MQIDLQAPDGYQIPESVRDAVRLNNVPCTVFVRGERLEGGPRGEMVWMGQIPEQKWYTSSRFPAKLHRITESSEIFPESLVFQFSFGKSSNVFDSYAISLLKAEKTTNQ